MKNKFEALKAFMSWPREWQELCAEFWAESEEPREARLDAKQLAIEPQQKTWEGIAMQACKAIYRGDFTIGEQEYLAKCHHETKTRREAANMFLGRFPGRSTQAVEIKIRKMLDANGVMHVGY